MTVVKALNSKAIAEISNAAHRAAYAAGSMFLEKHEFNQGRSGDGLFIVHGYMNPEEDLVPITKVVVGSKMRESSRLRHVGMASISSMLNQTFVGDQAWLAGDVQVSVKRFLEPVLQFIAKYAEHLDVFAGVYENKLTSTNVFGIYIMLKDVEDDAKRLCWEINIDDHDLTEALSWKNVFLK